MLFKGAVIRPRKELAKLEIIERIVYLSSDFDSLFVSWFDFEGKKSAKIRTSG